MNFKYINYQLLLLACGWLSATPIDKTDPSCYDCATLVHVRGSMSNNALRPSLADVAAKASVSVGTVSHVLNGNPKARIAQATQERIRRAADELGYRPNRFARSLAGKHVRSIGLMIPTLNNPFFISVAVVAQRRILDLGYEMVLDPIFAQEWAVIDHRRLGYWPVDGILMWTFTSQPTNEIFGAQASRMPIVYLGLMNDAYCSGVQVDFYTGMTRVLNHLIQRGRRNLAFVVPETVANKPSSDRRREAYFDAVKSLGGEIQILRYADDHEMANGRRIGLEVGALSARVRPDALVCYNDNVAIGVYHGLRAAGLSVPGDISLTGFDGIEEGQCLDNPLTTAMVPADLVCGAGIEMLIERIENPMLEQHTQIAIPTRLIVGATT